MNTDIILRYSKYHSLHTIFCYRDTCNLAKLFSSLVSHLQANMIVFGKIIPVCNETN